MKSIVSIIYVNYNTSNILIESIQSLESQCKQVPYELIIIDNASMSVEKEILFDWFKKRINNNATIIFSDTNLGFGKANNLGAKNSKGKYLFFLNPDTLIVNDVIKIFYAFLESTDQKIAACGGNLLRQDYTPNYSYGNFPGLLYEVCSIGFGLRFFFNEYYKKNIFIGRTVEGADIQKAPYIIGADIFIKSECFKLMKGFDENFFMYYEETDLFYRLKQLGYESYILPEAKIIHFEGGAIGKISPHAFNYIKLEMTFKSKIYYFSKWFPGYYLPFLKIIMLLQIIVQYSKGKKGRSFKKLFSIYLKSIKSPRTARLRHPV